MALGHQSSAVLPGAGRTGSQQLGADYYGVRMPQHAVATRSSSTLGLVLGSRLYRRATVSLFFAGLGISMAIPQLSLFLVKDLHASLPVAGLFFLTNLAAPVLGFVVGRWSDWLTDRLSLFRVGAVVGLVGWVVDGIHHPGIDGVRAQPHGTRVRRGDRLTDLRRSAGPTDARSHPWTTG